MKVLYFYTVDCMPCKKYGLAVERACEKQEIELVKINAHSPANTYNIMSVPVIMVERDGKILRTYSGAMHEFSIEGKIRECRQMK